MYTYTFNKTIFFLEQLQKEIRQNGTLEVKFSHLSSFGTQINITFIEELTLQESEELTSTVNAHTGQTTAQSLTAYLELEVFPFIKELIYNFAAENISMGITQAGKTGEVLGLFEKQYTISGTARPVSLKSSLDTGSLYIAMQILEHLRQNGGEYSDLSPFITESRLKNFKNKIEQFLGLPLSE